MTDVINTQRGVTLVVTSCNRHDLLKKTLDSFIKFNTCPIKDAIIIEDSSAEKPSWLDSYNEISLSGIKWISNGKRKGQIYSIDRAYSEVTTEYIFHCEDDWEFIRPNFIGASMALMVPHANVWTVNLRADNCNGHPVVHDDLHPEIASILEPYWNGGWGGCVFNPGLRRLSDYKKLGSYGRHMGYGTHGFQAELALSVKQLNQGYVIASLPDQYVEHIGDNRTKAGDDFRPSQPKVLIAIPACHKYEYKSQGDGRVHKDGARNERVEAVRDTWQKYLGPFTNVTQKFFYGRLPAQDVRSPLADEVYLDVEDDYMNLPSKVKAIYQWALEHGFDYVFKGDDDTFIYVDRLLASGFEDYDYLGFKTDESLYCSGGSGYWLSKKAMQALMTVPVEGWAEDRWVGEALRLRGILPKRDARYLPGFWEHFVDINAIGDDHSYITMHACTPSMMAELFAKTLPPNFKRIERAFHEVEDKNKTSVIQFKDHGSPHQGVPRPGAKPDYKTGKIDWWDTHIRPEELENG